MPIKCWSASIIAEEFVNVSDGHPNQIVDNGRQTHSENKILYIEWAPVSRAGVFRPIRVSSIAHLHRPSYSLGLKTSKNDFTK